MMNQPIQVGMDQASGGIQDQLRGTVVGLKKDDFGFVAIPKIQDILDTGPLKSEYRLIVISDNK